jgi:hypothetical protein
MAKKKKGKKGKGGKNKEKEEYLPLIYNVPTYEVVLLIFIDK